MASRRKGTAGLVVSLLLISGFLGVTAASGIVTSKTITTCTNNVIGVNRLLLKVACNPKTETKARWVRVEQTIAAPKPESFTYKVGDTGPGGGVIFDVDLKNEFPSFQYLEAA